MSRGLIIGMGCAPCLFAMNPAITILIVDDTLEPGSRGPMQAQSPLRLPIAEIHALTAAAAYEKPHEPLLTNREERRRNQPFYRGLKKYRKP